MDDRFEVKWSLSWDYIKRVGGLSDEQTEELKAGAENMADGLVGLIRDAFWEGIRAMKEDDANADNL